MGNFAITCLKDHLAKSHRGTSNHLIGLHGDLKPVDSVADDVTSIEIQVTLLSSKDNASVVSVVEKFSKHMSCVCMAVVKVMGCKGIVKVKVTSICIARLCKRL